MSAFFSGGGGGDGSGVGDEVAWFTGASTMVSPMASFPEVLPVALLRVGTNDHMRDEPPRSAVHSWLASADQETLVSALYIAEGTATSSSCVSSSGWNEHSARATTTGGRARSLWRAFLSAFSCIRISASSFSFASFAAKAAAAFLLSFFGLFTGLFTGFDAFAAFASSSSSELASGAGNFHATSSPLEVPAASICARPDFAVAIEVTAPFFTSIVEPFPPFPPNASATRTAFQ